MKNSDAVIVRADLLPELLYGKNTKRSKMLAYILDKTNPDTNVFIGRIEDIAKYSGLARQTVTNWLRKYKKADIVRNSGPCIWMFNPEYYFVGDEKEKSRLEIEYGSYPKYGETDKEAGQNNVNVILFSSVQ